jgi:hypothetical protein
MTKPNDHLKKIDQINKRLIELDIFKRMSNPPDSILLSDGFREFYNTILKGKILEEYEKDPTMTGIDNGLMKPLTIWAMISYYLEKIKKNPKELVDSISDEEMKGFVNVVRTIIIFTQERKIGHR